MGYKTQIIDFLPEYIHEYDGIRSITATEQIEFDQLWEKHDQSILDSFVMDASETGIRRWESIVGIVSKADSDLQERRVALLAKLNEQLPFTFRRLKEMVTSVCGDTEFKMELNNSEYVLDIMIRAAVGSTERDALGLLSAVDSLVRRIKPCNIAYSSSLFERHSGTINSFYGCAVSLVKKYNVEVIG